MAYHFYIWIDTDSEDEDVAFFMLHKNLNPPTLRKLKSFQKRLIKKSRSEKIEKSDIDFKSKAQL